jgi:hypothetical protein
VAATTLPGLGAVNEFLTGVATREMVVLEFADFAGNKSEVMLEIEPGFLGGPVFDVFSVDLLNAVQDFVSKSDADLNAIKFVSEVRDHTPATPSDDSNVYESGILTFAVAGGAQRSVRIPSVRDDLVIEGGGNVLDATQVEDIAAEFTGEGLSTRTFVLDNRAANKLIASKRVTRKTRR